MSRKSLANYKWGILLFTLGSGILCAKLFLDGMNVSLDKIDVAAMIGTLGGLLEAARKHIGGVVESVRSEVRMPAVTPSPTSLPPPAPPTPDTPNMAPITPIVETAAIGPPATLASGVVQMLANLESMRGDQASWHKESIDRHDSLQQSFNEYQAKMEDRHQSHEKRLDTLELGVQKIGEHVCTLCGLPSGEKVGP